MSKQSDAVNTKLGAKVDMSRAIQGAPTVVLAVQPQGYLRIETPEQLKQWEDDVRQFLGVSNPPNARGSGTEMCSGGCSDGCDIAL